MYSKGPINFFILTLFTNMLGTELFKNNDIHYCRPDCSSLVRYRYCEIHIVVDLWSNIVLMGCLTFKAHSRILYVRR